VRKRHNHSSIRDSQCVPFKCAAKSGRRAADHANIIPDVSYIKAKKKSNHLNNAGDGIELKLFRIKRVGVNQALKNINLSVAKLESLQTQRQELDNEIEWLTKDLKRLKIDASEKRKTFLETSKALKLEQAEKTMLDSPSTATMESILSHYEIYPAWYHGGKLNGVDCQEFMSKAKAIFAKIQEMLLSIDHLQ